MTETVRFEYERRVRDSDLPAQARHLWLTLATWCTATSGVIPMKNKVSLTVLTKATGMSRSTIAKYLDVLEEGGWLVRRRPTVNAARVDHERTQYRLTVPRASAPDGPASPPHGPELVRHTDGASPSGVLKESSTSRTIKPDDHDLARSIAEKVSRRIGNPVTTGTALRWMRDIVGDREVRDPVAYVVAIVTKPENRQRYLASTPTPPPWAQVRAQMESA